MYKKLAIHFVGIKGVGMTPLAVIAKEAGFKVTGSDLGDDFITDEILTNNKIVSFNGFSEDHINNNLDMVITTGAHGGLENVEVKKALENKIKVITQGEAVGLFMSGKIFNKNFEGISVAGTHGKTTTTAMLATIFQEADLDPSYIIGTGNIVSLKGPGHFGKGKYFIAEADEYASDPKLNVTPKFMYQNPKIAIITNIDFDHPDIYSSIENISDAFLRFSNNLKKDGQLIACGDDINIRKIIPKIDCQITTYGYSSVNDFSIEKVSISGLKTFFWVENRNTSFGEFSLNIPGEHYALDALAAIITALSCGIKIEKIKETLLKFTGTKRRFELIGKISSGATLYDDYAHHPTEIKSSLRAFRQAFPDKKIVCIFQPHTYSRTIKLLEDFSFSFNDTDTVIITDIYSSLRERSDEKISSKILFEKISQKKQSCFFLSEIDDVVEYIKRNKFDESYVLITMGAGDIYKIKDKLSFL